MSLRAEAQNITHQACADKVEDIFNQSKLAFAKMSLSSGKSLPKDAGKYVMCMDNDNTRYFLVKMTAIMLGMPMPVELGFCLPDVCDNAGVKNLMSSETVLKLLGLPELAAMKIANVTSSSPQLDLNKVVAGGVVAVVVVSF